MHVPDTVGDIDGDSDVLLVSDVVPERDGVFEEVAVADCVGE